jgi:hypothetical protein
LGVEVMDALSVKSIQYNNEINYSSIVVVIPTSNEVEVLPCGCKKFENYVEIIK